MKLRQKLLFGVGVILILYVGMFIGSYNYGSIILPSYSFVDGGNFIIAKGSWLSDTKLSDKAQTVQIHCHKEWGHCAETIASTGFVVGMLTIFTEYWKVKEWEQDKILFYENSSADCVNYNYYLDRKNQTITSIRTTKNPKPSGGILGCEAIQDDPIYMHLGDPR